MKGLTKAIVALGVTTLVAAPTMALPIQAQAALTCTIRVPYRISLVAPSRAISYGFASDCVASHAFNARWSGIAPGVGAQQMLRYNADGYFTIYDYQPTGIWKWAPVGASDMPGHAISQNTTYSDVRRGTASYLTPSRSGTKVSLRSHAMAYSTLSQKMIDYSAAGVLQRWDASKHAWVAFKMTHPDTHGYYTYSFTSTAKATYRFVTPDKAGAVWGTSSASKTI